MSNGNTAKDNVLSHIKITHLTPSNYIDINTNKVTDRSNYNSLKQICIITEDKGNGYQFVLSYILQNYPEISGIAIGAVGKDSFRYILEEYDNYDAYVFVIDRGISDVDFNRLKKTLEAFKNSKRNTPMYIFQPKCMEEVCISFYRLNEYIDLNKAAEAVELHYELEKLLTGNIADIDYSKYKTLQYSTDEKVCEKLIFDLTKGTPFKCYHGQKKIKGVQEHIPAYVSPCWRCPCCTVKDYDKNGYVNTNDCKHPNIEYNKMDYIAQHSLLCGLTYIIDKICGFHSHSKKYWNNLAKSYFNQLVREL